MCAVRKAVLGQPVEQLGLRGVQLLARLVEPEPARAVDLGELAHRARPRRPFERERVAAGGVGVDVALDREGRDLLAALELDGPELGQLALGQRRAELLLELARGARARVLVVAVLALRERPRARVLVRPERPAGVHEQHLADPVAPPVQHDAGAALQIASGTGRGAGRRASRNVGSSATSAPAALIVKAIVKPRSSGISVPASVLAEMIAAATCEPSAAPIVRMIVFMPLATPVSPGGEFSITRVPSAAKLNARPMPMNTIQA